MNATLDEVKKIILNQFNKMNMLVIGDIILDEYIYGTVERISPEGPIPILNYKKRELIAGGAANVANNLRQLGSNVTIVGVIGDDTHGTELKERLQSAEIDVSGLVVDKERPTTVKTRFGTKHHQLLRMDNEIAQPISSDKEDKLFEFISTHIEKYNGIVISDYRKGVISNNEFMRKIIGLCKEKEIPIGIDSKATDITIFAGASFIKPNNLELERAVGMKITDNETLDEAGRIYLERSKAEALVLTRGEKGISVFIQGKPRRDFKTFAKQVFDVTGAGDTVISTAILALVAGLTLYDATFLGNHAAGICISKYGTATVTQKELVESLYE